MRAGIALYLTFPDHDEVPESHLTVQMNETEQWDRPRNPVINGAMMTLMGPRGSHWKTLRS